MHGVQPIAKIAPSPKLASQPPRLLTIRPPSRSPRPGPAGRGERHRAGRGRQRGRGAGVERPPVPLERRDPEDAGEVQPEQDEDHAADLAQDRHPRRQPGGGERRRHPEQREHGAEPGDVGEGVAEGRPARGPARDRVQPRAAGSARAARVGDRDRRQLADVGGHERQDARAQEAEQPGGDRDEDRQVVGGHTRLPSRASSRNRRMLRAETSRARAGCPPSSRTGIVAKNGPLPRGIGRDVALVERRDPAAARGTVLEQALDDRARLVAQVAAGRRVQDELGEGSGHRSRILGSIGADRLVLLRRGPDVTNGRDWTSERRHPMMRAVDGRTRRSPRGDRGDGRLRTDPGLESGPGALARPGRRFLLFVADRRRSGVGRRRRAGWRSLHDRQAGRILPGISVAGVDVGGMTRGRGPRGARQRVSPICRPGRARPIERRVDRRRVRRRRPDAGHRRDGRRGGDASGAAGPGSTRRSPGSASSSSRRRVAAPARLRPRPGGRRSSRAFAGADGPQPDRRLGRRERHRVLVVELASTAGPIDAAATIAALDAVDARSGDSRRRGRRGAGRPRWRRALTTDGGARGDGSPPIASRRRSRSPTARAPGDQGRQDPAVDRASAGSTARTGRSSTARRSRPRSRRSRKTVARPVRDAEFLRDKRGRIVGSKADRRGPEARRRRPPRTRSRRRSRPGSRPARAAPVKLAVATDRRRSGRPRRPRRRRR